MGLTNLGLGLRKPNVINYSGEVVVGHKVSWQLQWPFLLLMGPKGTCKIKERLEGTLGMKLT